MIFQELRKLSLAMGYDPFIDSRQREMANKNITNAQKRRMDIITKEVGCICCRIELGLFVPAQANHLLNGYRVGHDAVVPECPWHHMGECLTGTDARAMRKTFGPSRRLHKKSFTKRFGSDKHLLIITNKLVAHFEAAIVGGGKK